MKLTSLHVPFRKRDRWDGRYGRRKDGHDTGREMTINLKEEKMVDE